MFPEEQYEDDYPVSQEVCISSVEFMEIEKTVIASMLCLFSPHGLEAHF